MKPGMVQTAEMADRQEFLFYYAEAGPAGLGEKKQKKKNHHAADIRAHCQRQGFKLKFK